ncbi:MAG: UDP-N-acetylmuramoyl-L-alanine--D-glutamate ligase [Betaproteobacteria bacterium]
MMDFANRRILVLGLGDTGLSLARWLVRRGAEVHVADSRADPPHADTLLRDFPGVGITRGGFVERDFARADAIAISPGIDRRQPAVRSALGRGVPVVGDVELFALALSALAKRPMVLAITGSNGKSTVTAMAGAMCREAGLATAVAGNIGPPVLDALSAVEDSGVAAEVFVLELSSFQLESTSSLEPDAAAMLNLCEDHMDRYDSLEEYAAAKARIFQGGGVQVLNRDDGCSMGMALSGRAVTTFGLGVPHAETEWGLKGAIGNQTLANGVRRLIPVSEIPLTGLHNAANALAALALVRAIDVPEAPALAALRRFRGLPHRLEKVADIGGVTFYNDSKGTNLGATVAALSGMTQPVVLIAGGDGKAQDFLPLASAVSARARAVVLIGRDADAIAGALAGSGVPLLRAGGMDEAVAQAYRASRTGDAVLLSPACASYDMFRNYAHRGEVFVAAVHELVKRGG